MTPPAGIEQIQKSVEEMKLPKGRLARILYQNAGWLKPAGGILAAGLMLAVFYLQGKKRCLALKKKSRENDCRRIIWLRTAGGKDQRNQNGRTDRTEYFRDSERKFPEITAEQWEKLYGQVLQELLEERRAKSGAEKRTTDLAEKILQPVF